MSVWQCNSCGQVYPDTNSVPGTLPHVCYPDVIEHGDFDANGKVLKAEQRTPRANIRNENFLPGLVYVDGQYKLEIPDPTRNVPTILVDAPSLIIAEGKGRTKLE